jgi:carbonic anhydrase
MIEQGKIGIIGAMHNIETGKVTFYKDVMYIKDELNPTFSVADIQY